MTDGIGNWQFLNKRPPRSTAHIALVETISERDRNKLNDWEQNFLASIVHYDNPTARRLEVLQAICAKALTRGSPRRGAGRRRASR